jgi:acyl phosphate:glycerol-3-phosphate acyltransferase
VSSQIHLEPIGGAHVALWLAAVLVGSYLIGSIPWSWLVVRWRTGKDVREVGSGNVGATNAMRAAGRGAGALALLLDVAKGVAPVLIVRALGTTMLVESLAAAAAVVGHMYPVWLRWRGGKGVATAAGALATLAPLPTALAALVFLVVVAATRYVSLASVVCMVSFPLLVLLLADRSAPSWERPSLAICVLIPALSIWKHRGNVRRLLAGTERRLGAKREAKTS